MARHAWLSLKLARETLGRGLVGFVWARRAGATTDESLAFAGYLVERGRQSTIWPTSRSLWQGVKRSSFRFMRGPNAENYDRLGRRIVAEAIRVMYGRRPGAPVLDRVDHVLCTLIRQWEEGGDFYPLRDYIEEQGSVMSHILELLEGGCCPVGTWPF